MAAHDSASAKAIETAKRMKVEVDATDSVELKSLMGDLILQLAEVQIETAGRIEELDRLKRRTASSEGMKLEGDVFYRPHLFDGTKEGPFCARCLQADQKEVLLIKNQRSGSRYKLMCPVCNTAAGPEGPPPAAGPLVF